MNTYGWDSIYLVDIDDVNKSLAQDEQQLIRCFDTSSSQDLPLQAKGNFSRWELVPGGSGSIIHLKISIGNGTVSYGSSQEKIDLSGMYMIVAVQLAFISSGMEEEVLQFNIKYVGEADTDPEPGAIVPVRLGAVDGRLNMVQSSLLLTDLCNYLCSHDSTLCYVFATINLNPAKESSWLTPVKSAYAYVNREGSSGALAILSVTDGRDITKLPLSIDPDLLSPGYNASFGISKGLLLKHIIQPCLSAAFGNGATGASFSYDSSKEQIKNTKMLRMEGIKSGAITYYPKIEKFSLTTEASFLVSHYYGKCDLKAGVHAEFWLDTRNDSQYNTEADCIIILPDPEPESRSKAHIPWYWAFLGPLWRPIMGIIIKSITNKIEKSLSENLSKNLTFVDSPPSAIKWTGSKVLKVEHAGINQGLYLQGTLEYH